MILTDLLFVEKDTINIDLFPLLNVTKCIKLCHLRILLISSKPWDLNFIITIVCGTVMLPGFRNNGTENMVNHGYLKP